MCLMGKKAKWTLIMPIDRSQIDWPTTVSFGTPVPAFRAANHLAHLPLTCNPPSFGYNFHFTGLKINNG